MLFLQRKAMNVTHNANIRQDSLSYLWLALATVLGFFSFGKWIIPLAVWLGIVFSIRFIRTQPPVRGLIIYVFASMIPLYFTLQGMPIPGMSYFVFVAAAGLIGVLPFLAERLITPRLNGFVSTLVLPMAWTSLDYVSSVTSGSWGSLAYTQYGNLPLLQVLSITGMWGITFLIAWFASVVNWAWERQFEWKKIRVGAMVYAGILALVFLFGIVNLIFLPASDSVKVASIAAHEILLADPNTQVFLQRLSSGEITEAELESLRLKFNATNDDLLERSKREARSGAKIIYWAEANSLVLKQDEAGLIEQGRMLAHQEGIYLGMAIGTLNHSHKLWEDKIVLIEPSGEIAWEYFKARSAPGEGSMQGDGKILASDTPYGRIASSICYDMDFPNLILQAGEAEVDMMLTPANDWKKFAPLHMKMATFRAIENGFSLVRPTSDGSSVAVDYRGRVLETMDYFTSKDHVMISYVPKKGVSTVYSQAGDIFAWLCIAGFVVFLGWAMVNTVLRRRI
jgi:apolipoprotein N-acyltransferase